MKLIIASFLAGAVIGSVFSLLQLPIPAPQSIAGVMGIVGVFVGYLIVKRFSKSSNHSRHEHDLE